MEPQSKPEQPGTKIRPATALPYPITVDPDANIVGPWRGNPPLAPLSLAEKREVVRRANAYPNLAEEVAYLADILSNVHEPARRAAAAKRARALLRSLGESA